MAALDGLKESKLKIIEPVGYLEFLALQSKAKFVLTDSGGIQEETTYLGIPCITMRENTERPITVTMGTNVIVGTDASKIRAAVNSVMNGAFKKGEVPPLWDGKTSERIVKVLLDKLSQN